jgi:hypothetical protein
MRQGNLYYVMQRTIFLLYLRPRSGLTEALTWGMTSTAADLDFRPCGGQHCRRAGNLYLDQEKYSLKGAQVWDVRRREYYWNQACMGRFTQLRLLPLDQLIKLSALKFIRSFSHNLLPWPFCETWITNRERNLNRELRNANDLYTCS